MRIERGQSSYDQSRIFDGRTGEELFWVLWADDVEGAAELQVTMPDGTLVMEGEYFVTRVIVGPIRIEKRS